MTFALNSSHDVIQLIIILFAIILLFVSIIRMIKSKGNNKKFPVQSCVVTVVSKRIQQITFSGDGITKYYSTFQLENKKRIELQLSGEDYGLLAEGDYGKLMYQGNRFINFERK